MSSILRALKKLDDESLSAENPKAEAKIKMRQLVGRRSGRPWRMHRFAIYVLVILFSATALWFFLKEGNMGRERKINPLITQSPVVLDPPARVPLQVSSEITEKRKAQPVVRKDSEPVLPATAPTFKANTPPPEPDPAEPAPITKPNLPTFVLTGTLWSETPERRVALINDRYLKEGENFNGVTVLLIEKEAVTLQRGQETWTIRVKK